MTGTQDLRDRARIAADAAGRSGAAPNFLQTVRTLNFRGHGDVDLEPISFDAPFVAEPSFTYGVKLLTPPNAAEWRLPQVTLMLTAWLTDERDFFIGARMQVSVFMAPQPNVVPTVPAWCSLALDAVFGGLGFKDGSQAPLTGSPDRISQLSA